MSGPILRNHDPNAIIGRWYVVDGKLRGRLSEPLPRKAFWRMLGEAGVRFIEESESGVIEFEVLEFSVCDKPTSGSCALRLRGN